MARRRSLLWLALPAIAALVAVAILGWDVVVPSGGDSRERAAAPDFGDEEEIGMPEEGPEGPEGDVPFLVAGGRSRGPGDVADLAEGAAKPGVDAAGTPVGTVHLVGTVLDPHGRSAEGVTVAISGQADHVLVTDGQGRFEADVPLGRYDLLFLSEGMGTLRLHEYLVDGSGTKPLEFNLLAPSTVTVVVERAGAGLTGALVTLTLEEWDHKVHTLIYPVSTDVVGQAVFKDLPSGTYDLEAHLPEGPLVKQRIGVTKDQRVVVRVPDAVRLSGTVTDAATGAGLGNAVVTLTTWGERGGRGVWYEFEMTTGPGGVYEVVAVKGGPRSFDVKAEGYAAWPESAQQRPVLRSIQPMANGTAVVRDVALARGASVEGRVLMDKSQSPLPNVTLAFRARQGPVVKVTSKEDGAYAVMALNPDVYEVVVETPGWFPPAPLSVRVGGPGSPPVKFDVLVRGSCTLDGIVVRKPDIPVAGARVWIWGGDQLVRGARNAGRPLETFTDGSGAWRLTDVPSEANVAVRAAVGVEEAEPVLIRTDRRPPEPIRLTVGSTVTLKGHVVELGSRAAVPGVRVRLIPNGPPLGRDWAGVNADAEGAFTFHDLIPGLWDLVPVRPDYLPAAPRTVNLAGDLSRADADESVDLILDPGLLIAGVVVDEAGRPLAGARVRIDGVAGDGKTPVRRQANTDARGFFRTTGFVRGTYRLSARRDGFGNASAEGLLGGEERLVVTLRTVPKPP